MIKIRTYELGCDKSIFSVRMSRFFLTSDTFYISCLDYYMKKKRLKFVNVQTLFFNELSKKYLRNIFLRT